MSTGNWKWDEYSQADFCCCNTCIWGKAQRSRAIYCQIIKLHSRQWRQRQRRRPNNAASSRAGDGSDCSLEIEPPQGGGYGVITNYRWIISRPATWGNNVFPIWQTNKGLTHLEEPHCRSLRRLGRICPCVLSEKETRGKEEIIRSPVLLHGLAKVKEKLTRRKNVCEQSKCPSFFFFFIF